MHKVLVNCLVKHAEEKRVFRRTDCLDMTIAVDWDVKQQNKQKKNNNDISHTHRTLVKSA